MKLSNRAVYRGAMLTFCMNFAFWIAGDRKRVVFSQFAVCMGIPLAILLPIASVMFVAVNALKGEKYLAQWHAEDALEFVKRGAN